MVKAQGGSFRVLLVEDNPHVSELFNYAIKRLAQEQMGEETDIDMVEVGDGHAAWQRLEAVDEATFDLVVLDLNLPILDGIEVLTRIRSSAVLANLPVLVVTAADVETCEDARARGANLVLRKPVQLAQIRRALQEILQLNGAAART